MVEPESVPTRRFPAKQFPHRSSPGSVLSRLQATPKQLLSIRLVATVTRFGRAPDGRTIIVVLYSYASLDMLSFAAGQVLDGFFDKVQLLYFDPALVSIVILRGHLMNLLCDKDLVSITRGRDRYSLIATTWV
jgi:hypothetical protein